MKGTNKIFPFLSLLVFCILFQTKETIARSRISKFYNRFIRNAQDDPPNFIERIVNASIPRYNHYMLATTELVATDPSCRKLCPKVIETDNEDIGCSIGTEDTLEDDGKTVKTMAHDTILEAQPGLVKCLAIELNRTVLDDGLNVNLTCLCQRSTITRKPGVYCGPTNAQRCTRNSAKWIDGTNTYFKKLFEDYYYQGRIVYTIQDAKDLLEGGAPGVIARPQG